jgi:hypothetical protein
MMFHGDRWVSLRAEGRSPDGNKPLAWVRLTDVSRVEVVPLGDGSSYWKVMVTAGDITHQYGESFIKYGGASEAALGILNMIAKTLTRGNAGSLVSEQPSDE